MLKVAPSVPASSGELSALNRISKARGASAAEEKARLKKASKEFESFFTYYLMKTMRSTVPQNPLTKSLPLNEANSREMMQDLFDMEIARTMRSPSDRSLSSMLYNSMSKLIDARYAARETTGTVVKPLDSKTDEHAKSIPLHEVRKPLSLRPNDLRALDTPAPFLSLGEIIESIRAPEPDSSLHLESAPEVTIPDSRQIISEADAQESPIRRRFGRLIDQAAERHQIDSSLIEAIIRTESNGNPHATSPAGARGLMQLMPGTAKELLVSNSFDPAQNIDAGTRYFRKLLDRFGDHTLALAAYNAGPTAVVAHQGVPPYPETQRYVETVLTRVRVAQTSSTAPAKDRTQ